MRALAPLLTLALSATGTAAPANNFTFHDAAKLKSVRSAKISPAGDSIAYEVSVPRDPYAKKDGPAYNELHVTGLKKRSNRPFVTGAINISGVDWTPNGRGLSFLTKRGEDKKRGLYIIPIDGGEAQKVLSHEENIGAYDWSPDGEQVAFIASEKRDDKALKDRGFIAKVVEEDARRSMVHIATLTPGEVTKKSKKLNLKGSASEVHFSPDGKRLAVVLAPSPSVDDRLMQRRIHIVDNSGRVLSKIENPGKLGRVVWAPDGKHIVFISGEDINDPRAGRLFIARIGDKKFKDLVPKYQGHIIAFAFKDARTIRYIGHEGAESRLGEVMIDGQNNRSIVPPGGRVLTAMSLSKKGDKAAFVASAPAHPSEVFFMNGDEAPARLTDQNPWLKKKKLAKQEVITYEARDGLKIEGILIHPLNKKRKAPMILSVHGGPEAHRSNGWLTDYARPGQYAAAAGFAVFYPNYRGSTGRGVAFSKLGQADYAGKEFDDLVDAIAHLSKRGVINKKRVGITGGSYGGYASAWGATALSEHFAASVMLVGISDQISKFGTTDIPTEMIESHARKRPWKHWEWFLKRSPIYHVEKNRTPILIAHGDKDPRVHPSQSIELYRYLKAAGKAPVRLVLYPGEPHGNRKAAARLDFSMRLMRWMGHYLKGPGGKPPPYALKHDAAKLK